MNTVIFLPVMEATMQARALIQKISDIHQIQK